MIGSWWTVKVEARPEENVLWSRRANRTEDAIARGGKLFLTTERLLFLPSRFEASNGVGPHSTERSSIISLRKQSRDVRSGGLFSGAARDRLGVRVDGQPDELYVVPRVDSVISRLREALNAANDFGADSVEEDLPAR